MKFIRKIRRKMHRMKRISEISGLITIFLVALLAGQLYYIPTAGISIETLVAVVIITALLYFIVLLGQVVKKLGW